MMAGSAVKAILPRIYRNPHCSVASSAAATSVIRLRNYSVTSPTSPTPSNLSTSPNSPAIANPPGGNNPIGGIGDATPPPPPPPSLLPPDQFDFGNTEFCFRSKSNWALMRGLLIFRLCSVEWLVTHNKAVMRIAQRVLGTTLFSALMRHTVYAHFVAGRDERNIQPLIRRNREFGVKSILDYSKEEDITDEKAENVLKKTLSKLYGAAQSLRLVDSTRQSDASPAVSSPSPITSPSQPVQTGDATISSSSAGQQSNQFQANMEFANRAKNVNGARTYVIESEKQCDRNMDIFMQCIEASHDVTPPNEGLAAIKLTALGQSVLLMHMSEILNQMENLLEWQRNQHKDEAKEAATSSLSASASSEAAAVVGGGELDNETASLVEDSLKTSRINLDYDQERDWLTMKLETKSDSESIDLFEWGNLMNYGNKMNTAFDLKQSDDLAAQAHRVPPLSEEGVEAMQNMLARLDKLGKFAKDCGVRLMIDAEQSYFQPAIRRITLEMMRKYNKGKAVVFGTYQCYLKSALNQVQSDLDFSEKDDFYFSAKLVRGAYMEQERERAQTMNYEDPINPDFAATTQMYAACLDLILHTIRRRPRGSVSVMVATHNEETVQYAVSRMQQESIGKDERLVCFGQLLGMCDHLSFTLGQHGYSVYKYVPYGDVLEVLPYLSRRLNENRSILKKLDEELMLIKKELRRRIRG